jgi:hypothetical protein
VQSAVKRARAPPTKKKSTGKAAQKKQELSFMMTMNRLRLGLILPNYAMKSPNGFFPLGKI